MLTLRQYARKHKTPLRTLRYWCQIGRLRAVKAGRDWMIAPGEKLKGKGRKC